MHFYLYLCYKNYVIWSREPVAGTGAGQDWTGSTTLPVQKTLESGSGNTDFFRNLSFHKGPWKKSRLNSRDAPDTDFAGYPAGRIYSHSKKPDTGYPVGPDTGYPVGRDTRYPVGPDTRYPVRYPAIFLIYNWKNKIKKFAQVPVPVHISLPLALSFPHPIYSPSP